MSDDDEAGSGGESADAPSDEPSRRRPIRSFVLRQGRLTTAQQRAFDQHWQRFGLEPGNGPLDLQATFGRDAERVLEIGFGNGEALRFAAANEPHRDFIGIEVHRPGVGHLLNALAADGLDNVRVYSADAVEVLHNEFGEGALDEIRIYFPDPWHKKRHHKRRLLQPAIARLLGTRLKPGGLLHLATDWQDYAEQMWDVLDAEPLLLNQAGPRGSVPCPPWRPRTRFETRGLGLGHGVWDLLYRRC